MGPPLACGCNVPAGAFCGGVLAVVVNPSNLGSGPAAVVVAISMWLLSFPRGVDIRLRASSGEGSRPAWACPMSLSTTPNPAGVSSPRFSVSAICQICVP